MHVQMHVANVHTGLEIYCKCISSPDERDMMKQCKQICGGRAAHCSGKRVKVIVREIGR